MRRERFGSHIREIYETKMPPKQSQSADLQIQASSLDALTTMMQKHIAAQDQTNQLVQESLTEIRENWLVYRRQKIAERIQSRILKTQIRTFRYTRIRYDLRTRNLAVVLGWRRTGIEKCWLNHGRDL